MGISILQQGVGAAVYLMIFAGWYLLFEEEIQGSLRKHKRARQLAGERRRAIRNHPFIRHIEMVAETASEGRLTLSRYLLITATLFAVTFLATLSITGIGACFLSLAAALFFYGILRLRLESLRYKGSSEAELLVSMILNSYRSSHCNIYEALDLVVRSEAPGIKVTGKALFRLLLSLRDAKNKEEIRKAVDEFSYTVKTNWCNMLSQCIFAAAGEGINITVPLEEIMEQLKEAKRLSEERKRLNSESTRMIRFLIPLSYGASLLIGVKYLGVSSGALIRNQFFTKPGLFLFLIIFSLAVTNFMLVEITKKGKFDY